jgi:hypothetical protein
MPNEETPFYRSSNGDQWFLIRGPGGAMSVRHQPNRASGGRPSIIGISDFLSEGHGPQHEGVAPSARFRAGSLNTCR